MKEVHGTVHLTRPRREVERHVLGEWLLGQKIGRIITLGTGAAGILTGAATGNLESIMDFLDVAELRQDVDYDRNPTSGFQVEFESIVWRYEFADTPDGVDLTMTYMYPGMAGSFVPRAWMELVLRRNLDRLQRWSSRPSP